MKAETYVKYISYALKYLKGCEIKNPKYSLRFKKVIQALSGVTPETKLSKAEDITMDSINSLVELTFLIPYESRMKIQMGLESLWAN